VVFSTLTSTLVGLVDTLFMGWVSTAAQAAVGLGGILVWSLASFFTGVVAHFGKVAFQIFDAMGMVSGGILRGAGDTRWPMVVGIAFPWLVFLPLIWLFGFRAGMGYGGRGWAPGSTSLAWGSCSSAACGPGAGLATPSQNRGNPHGGQSMSRTRRTASWTSILALLILHATPARADDPFVDTRLTVTLGDDDLLHDAGARVPDTPRLGFGDRSGYQLFYDNLNTRFSGRESLTHLVFHRKMPSYFSNLTTEGAVVMRMLLSEQGVRLEDTGSYIRVGYHPFEDPEDGLTLVAFPFNADRVRLGYLYRLSLGGDDAYPRRTWVSAPGVKLQLDLGPVFGWGAFKAVLSPTALAETTEQGTKELTSENETIYAGFFGLGADLARDQLRVEVAAAYIEQAENIVADLEGEKVAMAGGAARVVVHFNMGVEDSLDYAIYRNDPNNPLIAFRPVEYRPGETGFMASAEAVWLTQHLASTDSNGDTRDQGGLAWALRSRLQRDYLRLELTLMCRDPGFLTRTEPGFPTWFAFPEIASTGPEMMASLAADYHFPEQHLTLGLSAGVLFPAHITTPLHATGPGSNAPPTLIGTHTVIFDDLGQLVVLPEDNDPRPMLNSRLSLRWDLSEMLYTQLWLQYGYDGNRTTLAINPDLTHSRVYDSPHAFGLGLGAALRL